jgi:methyl-accepting chemotaxis protein
LSSLGAIVVKRDVSEIVVAERQSLVTIVSIVMALIAIAVPVLMFVLNRTAINPVRDLATRLKDLATGEADLRQQIEVKSVNCSQAMNCGKQECPCYGRDAHCWYEAGSYAAEIHCPKILSGTYASCDECPLYQNAIVTEIDEVATFINAFIRRIRELVAKVNDNAKLVGKESDHVLEQASNLNSMASQTSEQARFLADSAGEYTGVVYEYV